ncbi:hypothetical protein [Fluviicola taffensis]|uniref:Uncharacterized protein n=1 Tax=Fluviicola taffensis (strain DSM 16823 / NCIMB 13979 / RW262) TaxID=755732 RepID=F2IDZ0_FLUTR|nr:hypothetical protein [Fluviicola taffensis]AEA45554.1 hypothetical protein Fluta_3585 [Fluviicola taffensis DSM 16823]
MSYSIQVFLKNNSFSEEYAQEKHEGKDSLENVRYEWEDEFRLTDSTDVLEIVREESFILAGEFEEGVPFQYEIEDVIQFVFHGEDETRIVFSEKCLDEYTIDHDHQKLKVYLNDNEVVENPIPGVYIVLSSFPKELRS